MSKIDRGPMLSLSWRPQRPPPDKGQGTQGPVAISTYILRRCSTEQHTSLPHAHGHAHVSFHTEPCTRSLKRSGTGLGLEASGPLDTVISSWYRDPAGSTQAWSMTTDTRTLATWMTRAKPTMMKTMMKTTAMTPMTTMPISQSKGAGNTGQELVRELFT